MKKKVPFVIAYWWCMALFLLGLLPLALGNHEGGVSETENRTLQALPRLSASTRCPAGTPSCRAPPGC